MLEIVGSGSTAAAPPPPPQSQSSGAGGKSTASTADTSPAKAWADAVAQATANSPQQRATVKPGDTLTGVANNHNDTVQRVETANPQIANPNLIYPGQPVYLPKTTPDQVVTGVDNSHIKPVITAMANANSADQGLQDVQQSHIRNRALLGDAQAQSAQSWDTVRQTTLDTLMNNNAGAYPEQAAAAEVRQLNPLEPGNAKFAAANNAALTEATQQWRQMGVTKPQLSPIINAYNNARQTTAAVNQYLQNPHMPHNRAIVEELNNSAQQANTQLNAAIEKSLTDAANQAGADPKARSEAMTERAANIQLAGPQDQAFHTAVDNANYDLQVNKPAQAVADAYAKGGAEAAAQALKTATQNAGNPYYAGQIIQQSQGTIGSITRDMGSLASNVPRPSRASMFGPTPGETKFSQIYADLSQSVGAANTVTTSGSLSPGGKAAADIVANSIAANAPKNLMPWQSGLYGNAAEGAITNGDGVALTLATAAALKRQGNTDLASFVTEGAATGIQALQSKTNDDVTAFATTTNNLHQLRTTWGPFMTESQLVNATNGYLADHPDVRQKADAQLGSISQDGDAIAEAESAWHSYGPQLNGIDAQGDLSAAAKSLTGNNVSAAFAVSQSTSVNNAIAAALGPSMPHPDQGGGSVAQALFASPVWSLPRSTRSFVNATYKTINAQAKSAGAGTPHDQGKFTTLSTIGLFLTAENAVAKGGFPVSSLHDAATSAYTALGFLKYGGEIAAGLAKDGVFAKYGGKFGLSTQTLADLTKTTSGLTKTPWFKAAGSAYYGAGAHPTGTAAHPAGRLSAGHAAGARGRAPRAAGSAARAQGGQGTDPFNQLSSDAPSSNNNAQSDPLSQLFQTISQLSQQAGQIENGMGLTSLLSGAGPLLGAMFA